MSEYTVIGFWNEADERHVVGVVEGDHVIHYGVDVTEGGLFAELVRAENAQLACDLVHNTGTGEEF